MTLLTDPPTLDAMLPAQHAPTAYDEAVHQLSHTVHQLVLAALARARHLEPAAPPPPDGTPLSAREREVLQRLAAGDSNKAIARALDLSPHTVKRHVANILDKLDLRSRGQAAAWWLTRHARPLGH
jgi:DNA-binding NarL/FixJ family response regulator